MKAIPLNLIKIGGNIVESPLLLNRFLKDFSALKGLKILVHGGGKEATKMANKLGIETTLVDGRRITNEKMLEVAVMIYAGLCNKKIIAELQKNQVQALGLSGADGNSILSKKRKKENIDYGFVGDIVKINSDWIHFLLKNNITPVFCAITHDKNGQLLNTNADTIAQELAVALSSIYEVSLLYCFDKPGVLKNIDDPNSVIPKLTFTSFEALKKENSIHSGMIPKLENCFRALEKGVKNIKIANPEILSQPKILHTSIFL